MDRMIDELLSGSFCLLPCWFMPTVHVHVLFGWLLLFHLCSLIVCSYTIVGYKLKQYFSLTPNQSTVNNPWSFTTKRTGWWVSVGGYVLSVLQCLSMSKQLAANWCTLLSLHSELSMPPHFLIDLFWMNNKNISISSKWSIREWKGLWNIGIS